MRILGIMRVRNGSDSLIAALDSLAMWCDDIYVIDDRSSDDTPSTLSSHPSVTNVFTASAYLAADAWAVSEAVGLQLLYRMADFCRPDWVVALDHDFVLHVTGELRKLLDSLPAEVAALRCRLTSSWSDPQYPRMIPLLGFNVGWPCCIWRYYDGLLPGGKKLHNGFSPINISDHGSVIKTDRVTITHAGWNTLDKRIERVQLYRSMDPGNNLNWGVPYDRSLLFGYSLAELDTLKRDYYLFAALGVTRFIGHALSDSVIDQFPRLGAVPSREKVAEIVRKTLAVTTVANDMYPTASSVATAANISANEVTHTWRAFGIKPHSLDTWKLHADNSFVEAVNTIAALYIDPRAEAAAMVLACAQESDQIISPRLAQQNPGSRRSCDCHIAAELLQSIADYALPTTAMTGSMHDLKGFMSLLEALHRSSPSDVDLHLIVNNSVGLVAPSLHEWLLRRHRCYLHFVPTYSSSLHLIAKWLMAMRAREHHAAIGCIPPAVLLQMKNLLSAAGTRNSTLSWVRGA
jgi:glycosyltransferase involved in cell wall biosynthesis